MYLRGHLPIFPDFVEMRKHYLTIAILSVAVCFFVLIAVTTLTSPTDDNRFGLLLFVASVFGLVFGLSVLLLTTVYCRGVSPGSEHPRFVLAVRHGLWLAVLSAELLLLQWFGYLLWWTALFALGTVVLAEFHRLLFGRGEKGAIV